MEKKWLVIAITALFIAVAGTTYYIFSHQQIADFLSKDYPDVWTDTVAILYFSTTAEQDMNWDGRISDSEMNTDLKRSTSPTIRKSGTCAANNSDYALQLHTNNLKSIPIKV